MLKIDVFLLKGNYVVRIKAEETALAVIPPYPTAEFERRLRDLLLKAKVENLEEAARQVKALIPKAQDITPLAVMVAAAVTRRCATEDPRVFCATPDRTVLLKDTQQGRRLVVWGRAIRLDNDQLTALNKLALVWRAEERICNKRAETVWLVNPQRLRELLGLEPRPCQ